MRRPLPVANLFLLRDSRYPGPSSSRSTPDRVLPSLMNCTARVVGLDGPSDSSNLALRDPAPGVQSEALSVERGFHTRTHRHGYKL